jgi:hypothetical protein
MYSFFSAGESSLSQACTMQYVLLHMIAVASSISALFLLLEDESEGSCGVTCAAYTWYVDLDLIAKAFRDGIGAPSRYGCV